MTKEQWEAERQRLLGLREQAVQTVLRIDGAIALCTEHLAKAETAVPENRAARRRAK